MDKLKVVLVVREENVMVMVGKDGCDPVLTPVPGSLDDALAAVPGLVASAEEKWQVAPRNPLAPPAPKPKPQPKAEAKPAAVAAAQAGPVEDLPLLAEEGEAVAPAVTDQVAEVAEVAEEQRPVVKATMRELARVSQASSVEAPEETQPAEVGEEPIIYVDKQKLAEVGASYSGDRIGIGDRSAGQPVHKPVLLEGKLYISTGGSMNRWTAYQLVPREEFTGEVRTYSVPPGREYEEYYESLRQDPMGFYHGMLVTSGGKEHVLVGPAKVVAEAVHPVVEAEPTKRGTLWAEPAQDVAASEVETPEAVAEPVAEAEARCRVCGCTETTPCITDEGPCHWVEADLCSACAEINRTPAEAVVEPAGKYYLTKDGRGPFATIQEALDALDMPKDKRPMHNRYSRLSKDLQQAIEMR